MLKNVNCLLVVFQREGVGDELVALDRAGGEEVQHLLRDVGVRLGADNRQLVEVDGVGRES